MCGFVGFTNYINNSNIVLENMMNKIIHRGPDSGRYRTWIQTSQYY